MMGQNLLKKVTYSIKYGVLCIFVILILFVFYRVVPHSESKLVFVYEVKSYWKWGKVYRQDIYKVGYQRPWKVVLYNRKHTSFLFTPNIDKEAIESHFFEDNNDDGKWDKEGWWDGQSYQVKEDTNFDGKYDKTFVIKYIL